MKVTAQELAVLLNGKIEGDANAAVSEPAKIEEGRPGTISFLANPKYAAYAYTTQASILLVPEDFKAEKAITPTLIRVADVYACFGLLLEKFGSALQQDNSGIEEGAFIHESAKLGNQISVAATAYISEGVELADDVVIYPQVFLGKNVRVGKGVVLYPGVKIHHDCVVGDYCILHANVVLGSDGFGFAPQQDGSYKKIPQLGNVVLGDKVEIGANTVIDRATMGATVIENGVKLDNLIQVAHNVKIGENTVIAAQTGVAGSTSIGKQCMIGGQVGFVGHIKVADGAKIQAQSGVAKAVKKEGSALYGSPAIEYGNYLKSYAVFRQLPELFKRLNELEKQLKD